MAALDDLEAELAGKQTVETLAVYGDRLLAAGELRGDLIATDLALDRDPTKSVHVRKREKLLAEWLGPAAAYAGTQHLHVRYGFVQRVSTAAFETVLGSKAGGYVRAVELRIHTQNVESFVGKLAAAPRPWLRSLALETQPRPVKSKTIISAALGKKLLATTPRLESLLVAGTRIFPDFPHPTLRRLEVHGWSAVQACTDRRSSFPAVEHVAFDLATTIGEQSNHLDGPSRIRQAEVGKLQFFAAKSFPALRELDLSHNVRGGRGCASVYRILPELGVLPQLTVLRVPPLELPEQERWLATALATAAHLERVEIMQAAKAAASSKLAHARARIMVCSRPWPSRDRIQQGSGASFMLAGERFTAAIDVIVRWLDTHFETFDREAKKAWTRLFELLAEDGGDEEPEYDEEETETSIPHAILARALDTLTDLPDRDRGWAALRDRSKATRSKVKQVVVSPTYMDDFD